MQAGRQAIYDRCMVDPWKPASDPEWAIAIVIFAVDYALVARALRRRGDPVARARMLAFAAGLFVLGLALLSPIEHLALTSMLSFHMLQNVMIADWAPPLLVLGLAPAMAVAIGNARGVRTLVQPVPAFLLWLAVWYGVHVPAAYDYALTHRAALGVEHLLLIASGLAFWWPDLAGGRLGPRARVLYPLLGMLAMMPLNVYIALAGHPLYAFYATTPKLGGLSALADQRIAGAATVLLETAILGGAALLAARRLVREERRSGYPVGGDGESPILRSSSATRVSA